MSQTVRALGLLALPLAYILFLYGAVQTNPSFITDNFTYVWFMMVLVVITASLGLLWVALSAKPDDEEHDTDHGEAKKDAAR